jgi:ketosteroid isomerase-like protein
MSVDENRDLIQRLYSVGVEEVLANFSSYFAEDVVLIEADCFPQPGTWKGREDVLRGIGEIYKAIGISEITVHDVVADGPRRVIGLCDVLCASDSDEPFTMPVAELFLVDDGKVTEIRPFWHDTAKLQDRARLNRGTA